MDSSQQLFNQETKAAPEAAPPTTKNQKSFVRIPFCEISMESMIPVQILPPPPPQIKKTVAQLDARPMPDIVESTKKGCHCIIV